MLSPDQMSAQIEKIMDSGMGAQKSLSMPGRLELTHLPLSQPGRLMRLLCPIILIPPGTVDSL